MLDVDAGSVDESPGPDVPVMVDGNMLAPAFNVTIQPAAMNTPTTESGNMAMTTLPPAA